MLEIRPNFEFPNQTLSMPLVSEIEHGGRGLGTHKSDSSMLFMFVFQTKGLRSNASPSFYLTIQYREFDVPVTSLFFVVLIVHLESGNVDKEVFETLEMTPLFS